MRKTQTKMSPTIHKVGLIRITRAIPGRIVAKMKRKNKMNVCAELSALKANDSA